MNGRFHWPTRRWLGWAAAALMSTAPCARAAEPFNNEARILFLGDSITAAGDYLKALQLIFATQHPGCGILLYNGGVPGDTAAKGLARLDTELDIARPSAVVLGFGMNDVQRHTFRDPSATALTGGQQRAADGCIGSVKRLMAELGKRGIVPVLMSPPVFDDRAQGIRGEPYLGVNLGLAAVRNQMMRIAGESGLRFIDLLDPGMQFTAARQAQDPGFTLTTDRVHPNPTGASFIALQIALQLQLLPDTAGSEFRITGSKVLGARGGEARLTPAGPPNEVRFEIVPGAYPLPPERFDPQAWASLHLSNRTATRIAVGDLSPGSYQLKLDGQPGPAATHAEWAAGVVVSNHAAWPPLARSKQIAAMIHERAHLENTAVRPVAIIDGIVRSRYRLAARPTLEQVKELLPKTRLGARWEIDAAKIYEATRLREEATRERMDAFEQELRNIGPPGAVSCALQRLD
jgi:lysophospholipase L1-like esterase